MRIFLQQNPVIESHSIKDEQMYRSNDKQNVFDTIEKWGLKSLESRGERVEHGAKTKRLGTLLKWAVDLSSAVISSDFPLVLFVRHQVDGRKRTGGEAPTVSLHCEEYQLLEIQRVREPRERN